MPLYEFRCESSHVHEVMLPINAEAREATCPACGGASVRLISSARLGRLGFDRAQLIERTQASADAPGVVDRIPGTGSGNSAPTTTDPRHARLPRP
ncbi:MULTISPECIES: FmdB family zinc ribbon protein [unclassified Brachybacterium]|uniref:FmdB family zinc ribbon protein n=1 Tax=unclassified Brachybacterium TaxID=2623841 RepID=UPI003608E740